MATLTTLRNLDVIFNVDHSVGKHGRNHKGDVQLVQYLLNLVIASSVFVDKPLCGTKAAGYKWYLRARH